VALSATTLAALGAVAVLVIVIFAVLVHGLGALSFEFLVKGAPTGIGPAIVGTALIVALATLIAAPLGILVALYVTEFASKRAARSIRLALDLMNGLPSIIIGLFVFGLLVYRNYGQSVYAASIALAIIMLPLIARGSQEILLLVPTSLREAADALGVSHWRTVLGVILPTASGGILTSTLLAVARAAGETAPLIFLCSIANPEKFSLTLGEAVPNLPITIFGLFEEANPVVRERAWGAGFVLLSFIVIASLGARVLLARSRAKLSG
jgi:phosphate transport system permease protein